MMITVGATYTVEGRQYEILAANTVTNTVWVRPTDTTYRANLPLGWFLRQVAASAATSIASAATSGHDTTVAA